MAMQSGDAAEEDVFARVPWAWQTSTHALLGRTARRRVTTLTTSTRARALIEREDDVAFSQTRVQKTMEMFVIEE